MRCPRLGSSRGCFPGTAAAGPTHSKPTPSALLCQMPNLGCRANGTCGAARTLGLRMVIGPGFFQAMCEILHRLRLSSATQDQKAGRGRTHTTDGPNELLHLELPSRFIVAARRSACCGWMQQGTVASVLTLRDAELAASPVHCGHGQSPAWTRTRLRDTARGKDRGGGGGGCCSERSAPGPAKACRDRRSGRRDRG